MENKNSALQKERLSFSSIKNAEHNVTEWMYLKGFEWNGGMSNDKWDSGVRNYSMLLFVPSK